MKWERSISGARLLAIFILIFFGMFFYASSLWAQFCWNEPGSIGAQGCWGEPIPLGMKFYMTKGVSSEGESYQVDCLITGTELDKVKSLTLYVPGNKPIKFKNIPGVEEITWKAVRKNLNQFERDFPAGRYELQTQPKRHGSYATDVTHDFPPVPNILYPADGATNVTFPFSIMWEPIQGIQDLSIKVSSGYGYLEYGISPDDTSFKVEQWMFEVGQEYEVTLTGRTTDASGNDLSTWRKTRFSSAAQ